MKLISLVFEYFLQITEMTGANVQFTIYNFIVQFFLKKKLPSDKDMDLFSFFQIQYME